MQSYFKPAAAFAPRAQQRRKVNTGGRNYIYIYAFIYMDQEMDGGTGARPGLEFGAAPSAATRC